MQCLFSQRLHVCIKRRDGGFFEGLNSYTTENLKNLIAERIYKDLKWREWEKCRARDSFSSYIIVKIQLTKGYDQVQCGPWQKHFKTTPFKAINLGKKVDFYWPKIIRNPKKMRAIFTCSSSSVKNLGLFSTTQFCDCFNFSRRLKVEIFKKNNLDFCLKKKIIFGSVRMASTFKPEQARVPPAIPLPSPPITKVSFFLCLCVYVVCIVFFWLKIASFLIN